MSRASNAGLVAVVLGVAVLLKWHYSNASADDLRYVLAPTAALAGLLTGATFVYETGAGYFSRELGTFIVASCAGVNFLVIAWCMLGTMGVRVQRGRLAWLGASAGLAYAATVIVNAARIAIVGRGAGVAEQLDWLPPGQVHRGLGVVVYLSALMVLYAAMTVIHKRCAS